jgi:hypothetical protein
MHPAVLCCLLGLLLAQLMQEAAAGGRTSFVIRLQGVYSRQLLQGRFYVSAVMDTTGSQQNVRPAVVPLENVITVRML